jgi:hypothetical protein
MEKAQERKRRVNLDGGKDNSRTYNPFSVLSNVEISKAISTVQVEIGKNVVAKMETGGKIQEADVGRSVQFRESCERYKEINIGSDPGSGQCEGAGVTP